MCRMLFVHSGLSRRSGRREDGAIRNRTVAGRVGARFRAGIARSKGESAVRIVILGAGAVGGYYGGRLAQAGVPVTFLVREKRFEQLSRRGLRIQSVHGDMTIQPDLVRRAEEIEGGVDVVIVAVKNYHLQPALGQLAALVERGAKILPLMNGILHMETLLGAFGPDVVLGGSCYLESTLTADGDILQTSAMHDVVFGAIGNGDPAFLDELAEAFRRAGVDVRTSSAIMLDMWKKYLFLCTFSAVTAATRQPIGTILKDDVTFRFLQGLAAEGMAVAKAYEPLLPDDTMDQIMQRLHSISPRMTSSLHRDLEKGLPLELDSLQGALVEMGARHGISTPGIWAVYALLHPYRNGAVSAPE